MGNGKTGKNSAEDLIQQFIDELSIELSPKTVRAVVFNAEAVFDSSI